MEKNGEHYVTCGQMKVLERRADADGLSYEQMMENAGTGAAHIIMERYAYARARREDTLDEGLASSKVAERTPDDLQTEEENRPKAFLFCGKGNNGGDGFVVARILCDAGFHTTVILVDGEPKTRDSVTNLKLLANRPVKILNMETNDRALMELKDTPDIIVDAIYGTGFHGKLKGNGLKAAIYINSHAEKKIDDRPIKPVMVAALDIPSGLGGDMIDAKALDENSIAAHHTITFHAKKPVHLQTFAQAYCGEVSVVDIGIEEERLWNVKI